VLTGYFIYDLITATGGAAPERNATQWQRRDEMFKDSATKWNRGLRYEHLFDIGCSISTNKPFEELLAAIERRLQTLRVSKNETIEAVGWVETVEYEVDDV